MSKIQLGGKLCRFTKNVNKKSDAISGFIESGRWKYSNRPEEEPDYFHVETLFMPRMSMFTYFFIMQQFLLCLLLYQTMEFYKAWMNKLYS